MNINILMISIGMVALSSCSSAYKMGQTPDDLYYSAPKDVVASGNGTEDYLAVNNGKERYSTNRNQRNQNNNSDYYNDYDDYGTYRNDRWLRMSIGNPYRLSTFNNYYWNDWGYSGYSSPFGYSGLGYGLGLGYDAWGSSIYWNSYYNPYAFNYNPYGYGYGYGSGYGHIGIIPGAKPPVYRNTARPTVFNPRAYSNSTRSSNVNTARSYYNPRTGTYSNYNNSNSLNGNRTGTNTTNGSRYYYNNNNSTRQNSNTVPSYTPSNNSSSGRPQSTYTPSSSGNNGGGGNSGGSGGGVRRPTR